MPTEIGILVGRFQTDELHEAHKQLIRTVVEKHKKPLLFLGVAPVLVDRHDPLDFRARELMIKAEFPELTIVQIPDMKDNEQWVRELESRAREIYPTGDVTFYGGRESFLEVYRHAGGRMNSEELESVHFISATERRKEVAREVIGDIRFRKGVIYAAFNQYPYGTVPTVDIVPFRPIDSETGKPKLSFEILLGKKEHEAGWRFIGGHDSAQDSSYEVSARRELAEETGNGIETQWPEYICSRVVDDWRYRNSDRKIKTILFAALYIYGTPKPSDDIKEAKWVKLFCWPKEGQEGEYTAVLPDKEPIEEVHLPLLDPLANFLAKKWSPCVSRQ